MATVFVVGVPWLTVVHNWCCPINLSGNFQGWAANRGSQAGAATDGPRAARHDGRHGLLQHHRTVHHADDSGDAERAWYISPTFRPPPRRLRRCARSLAASPLAQRPGRARAFYGTIAVATFVGVALNFTPLDPIKALFWSAVINGVAAVQIMVMIMLRASRRQVMGQFTLTSWLMSLGWLATAAMTAASIGMFATWGS